MLRHFPSPPHPPTPAQVSLGGEQSPSQSGRTHTGPSPSAGDHHWGSHLLGVLGPSPFCFSCLASLVAWRVPLAAVQVCQEGSWGNIHKRQGQSPISAELALSLPDATPSNTIVGGFHGWLFPDFPTCLMHTFCPASPPFFVKHQTFFTISGFTANSPLYSYIPSGLNPDLGSLF